MKRILFLTSMIGFLGLLGCAKNFSLFDSLSSSSLKNYALAENGATVGLDTTTPEDADISLKRFPKALIDGDISSGWESTFTKYDLGRASSRQWRWAWVDLSKGKRGRHAVAVIPIKLPEKKLINQIVVYTIDTPAHPASLFGVKDLAVDYLTEEYEIPELREGPSQIVTRTEKNVALWHPVELYSKDKVTQKFPGRIQQNKEGKIVFRFKPVITQAIRIFIYDTNDSVLAGDRGYGYGAQNKKGIIRLQEIEVYGIEGTSPASNSNLNEKKPVSLNNLASKSLIVTASPVVTTNPQKKPDLQKVMVPKEPQKEKSSKEEAKLKEAESLLEQGFTYDNQGQYDQAITDFSKAIAINPNFVWAYYGRGHAEIQKGNYDQAIADFAKAIEINPNFDLALNALSWFYAQTGQNLDEALQLAKRAVELTPRASHIDTLGYVYYKMGNYQEAEKEILRALELEPENEEFQKRLEAIDIARTSVGLPK